MLNCWNPISGNFQSTFPDKFGPTFESIFYQLLSTLLHILTFGRKVHRYLIGRGSGQEVFVPGQGVCSNIKTLPIFHFSIRSSILKYSLVFFVFVQGYPKGLRRLRLLEHHQKAKYLHFALKASSHTKISCFFIPF